MNTVCLFGNGTSIAYNPALDVPTLTAALRRRFEESGEPVLAELAAHQQGDGFEDLLGPLDTVAGLIQDIEELSRLSQEFRNRVGELVDSMRQTYRRGVGIVLDEIWRKSAAEPVEEGHLRETSTQFERVTKALARGLMEVRDSERASQFTIGTLNYDCQLLAGLLDVNEQQIADLADPRLPVKEWGPEHLVIPTTRDLPRDRVAFLQLHGSIGWIRTRDNSPTVVKFKVSQNRAIGDTFWRRYEQQRDGERTYDPCVVLTNRKNSIISRHPFAEAYRHFFDRLGRADRLLILGYGFGDEPLNQRLAETLRLRQPARILIGLRSQDGQRDETREQQVAGFLGLTEDQITFNWDGCPGIVGSDEWRNWAAAEQ